MGWYLTRVARNVQICKTNFTLLSRLNLVAIIVFLSQKVLVGIF